MLFLKSTHLSYCLLPAEWYDKINSSKIIFIMAVRKFHRKTLKEPKTKKKFSRLLMFFLIVFFTLLLTGFFLFIYYGRDLPRPEKFTEKQLFQPTGIYDRTGEVLLYQIYGEEKREWVDFEQIPEQMKQAVISTEDSNFYNHFGIDIRGIARAILTDLRIRKPTHGGSTITQQLIRSSFLSNEKTIERKIKEIILTFDIERKFSKDQILEFYLNQVPFGQNCYGVQSASKAYFGKPISEASLPEIAILTSLIQAPSYLSPYGEHLDELLIRKDYVIDRMVKNDFIDEEGANQFKEEKITFTPKEDINQVLAPHFVLEIKEYLIKNYGENYLTRNGLKVYSTLDWELQESIETIVKQKSEFNKAYNANNTALVALDPWTGEILAMVGSKGYFEEAYPEGCNSEKNECLFSPQYNAATQGERQPGSAFKPFAYLTAFEKKFCPETILWNAETNFGTKEQEYIPQNYNGKFTGPITFRNALAQSINVPSIKVLYLAGGEETLNNARKMGITTLNKPFSYYSLPLVLGGGEVKLMEMVSAYGVFATEGYFINSVNILKIEDIKGNIIQENKNQLRRILDNQPCRLVNDILSDNEARAPLFGWNSNLYFEDYEVCAKTGTTQNYNDAWAIGYTPNIVIGVWVGNNNNAPMDKKPGVALAGPIFHESLEKALEIYPYEGEFKKPDPYIGVHTETDLEDPHSILHYLKKEDPLGPPPQFPADDPQYLKWERGIEMYLENSKK